ncbi:iron ABC transporter permease [Acidisoma cellulosilytica]|uniref:Iron ABC transporter permease n=1 Tax=Acidisoma cellulosilyticum TaxID=2802395 RepID=A0A964E412_9PROT|nr:iron ABC transporter permease [Acidisoma cellulosilyticum]MCB8880488.1 iron ABC transporter permease [Acidisoma cellulosilyticum]
MSHTAIPAPMRMRAQLTRSRVVMLMLGFLLVASFIFSAGLGAVQIPPSAILSVLCGALGLPPLGQHTALQATVLISIRLPRILLGLMVGASLSAAGAATQGMFRNPLADPGLIGISSGAALAAGLLIVLGDRFLAHLPSDYRAAMLPVAAFLGGIVTTGIVYRLASRDGRTHVTTMLLAGVALNAGIGAALGLLIFLSNDQSLRDLNFWLLGSLSGVTWPNLLVAAPLLILPALLLLRLAGPLNGLLLGETEAFHLGFAVENTKRAVTVLTALTVGTAVALTGVIGFVSLVVPHIARQLVGPDHRVMMPAALLLGASLLTLADLLARTLALPQEIPIGILTSAVGAPFFLIQLLRHRAAAQS